MGSFQMSPSAGQTSSMVFLLSKSEVAVVFLLFAGWLTLTRVWVKITTRRPQVLVVGSIYTRVPFWLPIFDPQPW